MNTLLLFPIVYYTARFAKRFLTIAAVAVAIAGVNVVLDFSAYMQLSGSKPFIIYLALYLIFGYLVHRTLGRGRAIPASKVAKFVSDFLVLFIFVAYISLTVWIVLADYNRKIERVDALIRNEQQAIATNKEPELAAGTAFFYNSDGDMFTNRHVVLACGQHDIMVRVYDGSWRVAKPIALSDKYDIAALSTGEPSEYFAAVSTVQDRYVAVPSDVTDVFSSGYSSPVENNFKLQMRWAQIQEWGIEPPETEKYIRRIRMDAYRGASGSAVLDYHALLLGIIFAGSEYPAYDPANMKDIGYGDKWVYMYDNNAIVDFANTYSLKINHWRGAVNKDPVFIWGHSDRITGLVVCNTAGQSVPTEIIRLLTPDVAGRGALINE